MALSAIEEKIGFTIGKAKINKKESKKVGIKEKAEVF